MARLPEVITVETLGDSAAELDKTGNPTRSQLVKKKIRLAATRGFDNSGVLVPRSHKFFTPQNSPAKFSPQAGSTPFAEEAQAPSHLRVPILGISAIPRPRAVQLPPHPPISPAYIRVPVISPRVTPDPSLEWDYDEPHPIHPKVGDLLQTSDCLREVEELTGLEDIQKITLVKG